VRVLLVGGGGREDALAWALRRSPRLSRLDCAPGNAGIARRATCLPVDPAAAEALADLARSGRYDLVVVGPEGPLVAGLADRLARERIPVFGPLAAAARLEGSKAFAKEFMTRHGIPTARYRVFDQASAARAWLGSGEADYPLVLKADGLAAGKGVVIAEGPAEARSVAESMLSGRAFGAAGARIVVEERLSGREVSFFALCDGERAVELAACQDYKRLHDGDGGPNTGGMGAYSPSVFLDAAAREAVLERIVRPVVRGLAAQGTPYRGVLYAGLMLTASGPQVLEFNVRFGDPEAQVLLPRLDGDWLEVLAACATGTLAERPLRFLPRAAVCVVMASAGYPERPSNGHPIRGLQRAQALEDVEVFHAGTVAGPAGPLTAGGRVLGVTAVGPDLGLARERAYAAVASIGWDGEHHRTDIASDAVRELAGRRAHA
jgi:phosphoribosylamine--glycine ligase